jgi:hypothetical protein
MSRTRQMQVVHSSEHIAGLTETKARANVACKVVGHLVDSGYHCAKCGTLVRPFLRVTKIIGRLMKGDAAEGREWMSNMVAQQRDVGDGKL